MSQCNNLDQCTSEECCREPACLDHSTAPTTRRESIDFSADDQFAPSSSSQYQFANNISAFPVYDNTSGFDLPGFDDIDDDPLQWPWLLPDQECNTTAPTNDHVQLETSLMGGWSDSADQANMQEPTHHLWDSDQPERHVSDSYICLWDGCMEMFSDAAQLETHMEVAHTQTESIDCRWGGCGTITMNPAEMQIHVNSEHLHLDIQPAALSSSPKMGVLDGLDSRRPKHPLYWSSENDDLLMRVRAQNLTFQQIASQYFPDKSARACQVHYAKLYNQQQSSDPQPKEQSPPLLSYTALQSASFATSPDESHHPSVDPSLIQASPAILSNQSSQRVLDHPPIQGNHECMWITDETTGVSCGARFGDPNAIQAHIESSHYPLSDKRKRMPATQWVCKWMGCARQGETRGTREKLKKHIRTHTGCKSLVLSFDNFGNSSTLADYSLSCRHCGQRFRDGTKLADHERTHTKENPHKCDVCEMAFASLDELCKFEHVLKTSRPY